MLISDTDKLGVCNQLPHLGGLGKEAEQTAFKKFIHDHYINAPETLLMFYGTSCYHCLRLFSLASSQKSIIGTGEGLDDTQVDLNLP